MKTLQSHQGQALRARSGVFTTAVIAEAGAIPIAACQVQETIPMDFRHGFQHTVCDLAPALRTCPSSHYVQTLMSL